MILNDHLALHMECKFRSENYSYSCSIPLESDRLLEHAHMEEKIKITFRLESALLQKLDDMRRVEKDVPSRSEMVRRLIERAEIPPMPEKKKARS